MAWPLVALTGLLDPNVYVPGYVPTGTDVGADISQVLNKVNELVAGANELNTANDTQDDLLSAHAALHTDELARINVLEGEMDDVEADIATNATNIGTPVGASNAADIATNAAAIAANASDIDDLEALHSKNTLIVTGDLSLDYSTHGIRNPFVINAAATVTLSDDPGGTGDWPVGSVIRFIGDTTAAAVVTGGGSGALTPNLDNEDVLVRWGDILECTVYNNGSNSYWVMNLLKNATIERNARELTATQSYSPNIGSPERTFMVSGQAAGNTATVTLPAIIDALVGEEFKGFHHGTEGSLKFLCSGTDQILDADGGEGDYIQVAESSLASVITLTAIPAIGGVYYWAASISGATS